MIRRLRVKFVVINMALIALVLVIVFGVICYSSYQQTRSESLQDMRMSLDREKDHPPSRFVIGGERPPQTGDSGPKPVFTVTLNHEGDIVWSDRQNVEIDDETLALAVSYATDKSSDGGVIDALNLRYLRRETPEGTRIAFADRTAEQTALRQLAFTLLLVGLGGMLAFFGISLFLARWALRPVQEAWAQQQRFIADASHELKTPLTVILANLNILQKHPEHTVAEEHKWIDNTQVEAGRMKGLVDNLLFLAKSDATQAPPERTAFSLSDAVWSAVLPFEPVAFEQGITLESDIAPNINLMGDAQQIRQLVVILLDNACKYAGAQGRVTVTLSRVQDKARLSVHNTGEPIAPDALAHIFERFYRVDKARARLQGGYGLGLAIAAQIVRSHGGKITAQSSSEEGTTLTVIL